MVVEKFYSVVAETGDGETKTLPVRGDAPGGVFQQVKAMPGVRRVGKVVEIDRATYDAMVAGRFVEGNGRHAMGQASGRAADPARAAPPSAEERQAAIGHSIAGPRVVRHAPVSGGEQPFKHLQAPPERPKPVAQPVLPKPAPKPQTAVAPSRPAAVPPPPAESAPAPAEGRSYRIVKSRRRDGRPYLLQRGSWQQQSGKRVFDVEWEKDFDDREQAEKHLGWVERNERELAEVNQEA